MVCISVIISPSIIYANIYAVLTGVLQVAGKKEKKKMEKWRSKKCFHFPLVQNGRVCDRVQYRSPQI